MSTIINADTSDGLKFTSDTSGEIKLQSAGSDKVTIKSNGDVGIGTSSPESLLHISTGGGITPFASTQIICESSGNNYIELNGGSTSTTALYFGDSSDNDVGGVLYNHSNNSLSLRVNAASRMSITSGGEVYIAGTTDRGAYNLQCNGTGVWGAGAYVNGSDERIKQDITPIDTGLDVVAKLNPVTYTYKEEWSKDQSIQTGFIAQELLTALDGKNYVDGIVQQGGEYMSVAYQNIIPILTKAIQEQQDIIKALETRIQALENA